MLDWIQSLDVEFLIETLYNLNTLAWIFALILLVLKISVKKVDEFTSYGKLQKDLQPAASDSYAVTHRFAFTSAYILSFLFTLQLALSGYIAAREWVGSPPFCTILVFIGAFELHLLRRIYECIFVHRFSPRPMRFHNYWLILAFYTFVILAPFTEMIHYIYSDPFVIGDLWDGPSAGISLVAFAVMFGAGQLLQLQSHAILSKLRPSVSSDAVQPYYVPHGGFFNYVSSPHYLAEVIIYAAFVVLTRGQLRTVWLVFAFVVVTMIHQAYETHTWYITDKRFGNYPKTRKILVPLIW